MIGLRGFLPLSSEIVSTRGQKLPSLLQNRSAANLDEVRAQLDQRRASTYRDEPQIEQPQIRNPEIEGDVRKAGRLPQGENPITPGRKRSTSSDLLVTPQMRSLRLIGNNNPRYQW